LSEGTGANRNAYGNVAAPLDGYIWDACVRKKVSVRSFGEFVHVDAAHKNVASVPGLEGRISPNYPPWDLKIPDEKRADIFIEEFHQAEAGGTLRRCRSSGSATITRAAPARSIRRRAR